MEIIKLDAKSSTDRKLYQWDTDRKILITTDNVVDEIHFSNVFCEKALVVKPTVDVELGNVVADIPNILLQKFMPINIYVVMHTENGARTTYATKLDVAKRERPADYVYTETEILNYDTLEKEISNNRENIQKLTEDLDGYLKLNGTEEDVDMNGKCINSVKKINFNDRIDLLADDFAEKLNIRIGYVPESIEEAENVEHGIQLNGKKFTVKGISRNETDTLLSLTGREEGTQNTIFGNETLEIKSGYGNTGIRFATDNAGLTYEKATWTDRLKAYVMEVTKGIKMVGKDNSYWWVDADKKAVYGNSLNKLEFRTDGEAKFSKDVRAKNITAEGTLTAKNAELTKLWGETKENFVNCANVLDFEGDNFTAKLKNAIESNNGITPIFIPAGSYEVDHDVKICVTKPNLYIFGEVDAWNEIMTKLSDYPFLYIGAWERNEGVEGTGYMNLLKFENLQFTVSNSKLVAYRDQEYNDIYETVFSNCSLENGEKMDNGENCILQISTAILRLDHTKRPTGSVIDEVYDYYGGRIGMIFDNYSDGYNSKDLQITLNRYIDLSVYNRIKVHANYSEGVNVSYDHDDSGEDLHKIILNKEGVALKAPGKTIELGGFLNFTGVAHTDLTKNRYAYPVYEDGVAKYILLSDTRDDLVNYYLKEETYTKEEIDNLIPTKPSDIGAETAGTADSKVAAHNISETAHNDIRVAIKDLSDWVKALLDSDDETLNQTSEIVAYIKSNKSLIDAITTAKLNVSDVIDNLDTAVANKALSASMGVKLKGLYDDLAKIVNNIDVPTLVSQLTNDVGYLTEHQDISGKLDANKLPEAINTALAQAKESGEFDGEKGEKGDKGADGAKGADGKDGTDGISATHSWNGTVLTVTSASGTSSADLKGEKGETGDKGEKGDTGATGAKGEKGADGKTPVKGTDYFTDADKTELVNAVLDALPAAEEVYF